MKRLTLKKFSLVLTPLLLSLVLGSCSQEISKDYDSASVPPTAYPQLDRPLLQMVSAGGFAPFPSKTMITLFRTGEISKEYWRGANPFADPGSPEASERTVITRIGSLDAPVLRYVIAQADTLVSGDLEFDPREPRCADAPVKTYTAFLTEGSAEASVVFMKNEECIEKKLNTVPASLLIRVFKSIESLAYSTVE